MTDNRSDDVKRLEKELYKVRQALVVALKALVELHDGPEARKLRNYMWSIKP